MRLFEFDNPVQTPEMIAAIIKRDCQPFLQATNNLKFPLYRGIRSILPLDGKFLHKTPCPIGRKPKDSPMFLHRVADEWFFNKTGIAFRSNAVFSTGNSAEAIEYGTVYIMIPIGNFDFCWSPNVEDLYRAFERSRHHNYNADSMSTNAKEEKIQLELDFDQAKYRFNSSVGDFRSGISSGNEMMIHCDYYYVMPFYDVTTNKVLELL